MFKNPLLFFTSVITISILLLTQCSKDEEVVKNNLPKPVKVTKIGPPDKYYTKKYPGKVEANQDAMLSFQVAGNLIELNVEKGQDVNKGTVIAKLDPIDYSLKVNEAKSIRDERKLTIDRTVKLLDKGFAPQAQYDKEKASLDIAQASLELAEQNLKYTEILAPFDGRVADTFVENHQNVKAKDPIAVLHGKDNIDIAIDVPENIVINIKNKKIIKKSVVFDSAPKNEYKVELKDVVMQADPKTQTYKVYMTMPTPSDINVLPGMTATIILIYTDSEDGLSNSYLVPLTSIFTDENKNHFVWTVNSNNSLSAKQVKLGKFKNNQVQVISGLQTGDSIVSAGVHLLRENQIVQPLE